MIDLAQQIGAIPLADGSTVFRVWAPKVEHVDLHLIGHDDRVLPMSRRGRGYYELKVPNVTSGNRYRYRVNDEIELPDPASRFQPEGVHGPSEVVDPVTFQWSSASWRAPAIEDYIIYELHVGTFTALGTFEAAIAELDRLQRLGITAIELMPIAEFPGARNWGYDGSFPFAAHSAYGGPTGLAHFVDACHQRGMAVVLDVVFNHFGPEGSVVGAFGNYFTNHYRTPWGDAINFDGSGSDQIRRFFIECALFWLRDLRIDAFRVDAVHAIYDQRALPFLRELVETMKLEARHFNRQVYLIAESDLNDPRVILPAAVNGLAFDAQWSDDLHHALHRVLTGEEQAIYRDFGGMIDLKRAYESAFVYTGQFSAYRQRSHGIDPTGAGPSQFVVCSQNHDQIGNRAFGDRLTTQLTFEQLKLAAASTILSPYLPLLFMGEEYGEEAPFQYFTSHCDPTLIEAVQTGRAADFGAFGWSDDVPDPQAIETFDRSKLRREHRDSKRGRILDAFYRELIRLRRELPAFEAPTFSSLTVKLSGTEDRLVSLERWRGAHRAIVLLNFASCAERFRLPPDGSAWKPILDSSDGRWGGPGSATSGNRLVETGATIELAPHCVVVLDRTIPEQANDNHDSEN